MQLSILAGKEMRVAKVDWKDADGTVASIEAFQTKAGEMYTVVFTYKVDGGWYGGTFTSYTRYAEGDSIHVRYDPRDPDRNNFTEREKKLHWFYVVFFALLGIMAIYLFLQPKVK